MRAERLVDVANDGERGDAQTPVTCQAAGSLLVWERAAAGNI